MALVGRKCFEGDERRHSRVPCSGAEGYVLASGEETDNWIRLTAG